MKKINVLTASVMGVFFVLAAFVSPTQNANKSFHDFTVKTIDGEDFPLSQLKGKKVLVVNVASKCGLTPQYKVLQALYEKYGGKDLKLLPFQPIIF